MVRLASWLAMVFSYFSGVDAMSMTKHLSKQLSQAVRGPPKNFLVLRLAHSGSTWLTAMLGAQEDTYITREAMYRLQKPDDIKHVETLGAQGVLDYLQQVLKLPSGNILTPNHIQFYCEMPKEAKDATSLVSHVFSEDVFTRPQTCDCLHKLGSECPLKFLGMTLDPTSQVLSDNLGEILGPLNMTHTDMPVILFRRSNVVKRSLASGGNNVTETEGGYSVPLHQEVPVADFMRAVRNTMSKDKILRQSADHFSRVKIVDYEDLYMQPQLVMEHIFSFLGMQGHFESWMTEMGDKHTPDDLRVLIKNFDELERELEKVSPCLAEQLRATTNKKFHEVCPDF
jgi:hypothetical protein